MKKIFLGLLLSFTCFIAQADNEYLTIRVRGMEIFVNYSNGKTDVTKLKKEDFGEKQEHDIAALAMMEKLSADGWDFADMELIDNGTKYLYIMKRTKK
ncbi:MAG TPA: hypothetical protein VK927_02530 [Adhaeribacter sp.]|nr:hypothetical protein [Adhaeribacter sp.]